ncbi:hypothetical protein NL108_015755 [Boleophthalmus pectinirostris]|nr:hypothetical protein NL108_015755 [Boleophthalmus pectinirostris]
MDLRVSPRSVQCNRGVNMHSPPAPSVLLGHLSTHCPLKQQHLKFNSEMEPDTTDEILRRNRSEQSADVKKILREHIMSRHPPQERAPPVASAGFRVPMSEALSPQTSTDSKKALRRTVSEPTLKWKPRKMMGARPNPLQRKISAPPDVRHRSDTGADSPCSSAPVSESSSCDSLLTDSATSLIQETGPPSLPHFSPLFRPLDLGTALSQRLQPVLVLDQSTGLLHHQLMALPDLSSVPVPPQRPLSALRGRDGVTLGSHRPVKRTRSEPTPYSPSPLLLPPLSPTLPPPPPPWTRPIPEPLDQVWTGPI